MEQTQEWGESGLELNESRVLGWVNYSGEMEKDVWAWNLGGFMAGDEGVLPGWGRGQDRCMGVEAQCRVLASRARGVCGTPRGKLGRGGGPPPGPGPGGARTERAEGVSRAEPAPPAPRRPVPLPRPLARSLSALQRL